MPLLDHFNPPLSRTHPWRSFHGAWAAAMARLLNQGVRRTEGAADSRKSLKGALRYADQHSEKC
jgi:hypothetical protein